MRYAISGSIAPRLRGAVLVVLLPLLVSCSSKVLLEDPSAELHNRSPRQVQAVMYRSCGEGENGWRPLQQFASLPAYSSVRLDIPLDCVDLAAFSADQRVLGTQYGIRTRFPFRWVLQ